LLRQHSGFESKYLFKKTKKSDIGKGVSNTLEPAKKMYKKNHEHPPKNVQEERERWYLNVLRWNSSGGCETVLHGSGHYGEQGEVSLLLTCQVLSTNRNKARSGKK